jgi:hypothetical protein
VIRLAPAVLVLAATVAAPRAAAAQWDWQIKPFLGLTFAGQTPIDFVDLDLAAEKKHLAYGVSVQFLGDVLGAEAEVMRVPGFFESGSGPVNLVASSSIVTLMGNAVVAVPRRISSYGLRPYAVGGLGLMRVHVEDVLEVFPVSESRMALNVGGGATGFFDEVFGVSWDLRYYRRFSRDNGAAAVPGNGGELSFWRLNMAAVFRY